MSTRTVRRATGRIRTGMIFLAALACGCGGPRPHISPRDYIKDEFMVPMRDGVRLFTAVYRPRHAAGPLPILLLRTPYSVAPYGRDHYKDTLGPSPHFHDAGYIFAYQDVRGCYMSQGDHVNMRPHRDHKSGPADIDESSDTYDTVDWLIHNLPGNNGRVGMYGISYPGFYVSSGIVDSHPAIKAASPQAPIGDWFIGDDMHHNGAFFLMDAFGFFYTFGQPRPAPTTERHRRFDHGTPDAYDFFLKLGALRNVNPRHFHDEIAFWNEMQQHGDYDDFWQSRNILPHLRNVHAAVMTVGGWFDAEDLSGALKTYASIERNNPGIVNTLVMGPWVHGGWSRTDGSRLGDIGFGANTSDYYREYVERRFFDHYLKDGPDPKLPDALVFATGVNRWMSFAQWPPADAVERSLYFQPGRALAFDSAAAAPDDADEYVSDPAAPVPYSANLTTHRNREYMIEDQRFAARRPDVLSYETAPLTEPLTLAGPVDVELFIASTGTDADFVVKLIDVWPDRPPADAPNPGHIEMGGYQELVRAEVFRAKFRHDPGRPAPLEPGKVETIAYTMPDVCHAVLPGHRLMVQVQSSWFPLVDRNPQRFCDIYSCDDAAFVKATQRVFRAPGHASRLRVRVLHPSKLALAG
ncbi:MAG: CocE/NonD family hydrolase [Phycisphaerae bacterium]